jgi:hypothetical protein
VFLLPSAIGAIQQDPIRRIFKQASLDLRFADNKNLTDAVTGSNLVTFTRASSGTFVGSDGVLRTAVTNLLLQSEDFSTTWTRAGILAFGSGSTLNTATAPDGASTADLITEDTATSTHVTTQGSLSFTSGTNYTVSCFVKRGTGSRNAAIGLRVAAFSGGPRVNIDLSTGATTLSGSGGTIVSQAYPGGWWRVSLTATATATVTSFVDISFVSGVSTLSYTGDGTSGIYLWGAQLEQSSTVGEYIPTTSTINSAPRFDHNPTTGESLGLLVEEARTNSVTNNTMVGAVAGTPGTIPTGWLFASVAGGLTREIIGVGTESGISYIDIRFFGTTTNANGCAIAPGNGAALTGQTWTGSTYWKLVGGSNAGVSAFNIGLIEETLGGVFVTGAFYGQTAPTSAPLITQRPTATRTLTGGVTVAQLRHTIQLGILTATAIDITLRIGLPQLEQGAFATSPILTSTAAATRSADVASITGSAFSSWYRQDEGTVFADINTAPVATIAQGVFDLSEGAGSERMFQRRNTGGQIVTAITDNGVVQGDFGSVSVPASSRAKSGLAYRLDDFALAINGSISGTDTSGTVPTPNGIHIGQNLASGQTINGTIRRLSFWPQRLANSTIQTLTQ